MQAITHENIKVIGVPFLTTLLDVEINILPNEHGKMIIKGYGNPTDTIPSIERKFFGQTVSLVQEGIDNPIFSGVLTKCRVITTNEVNTLEITVLTGSYLLDTERKSRSFQDVSMTYEDVVRKVLSDSNGAGIFSVGKGTPIGHPIIQYKETDWEFIKRLASHFNSPIIADSTVPKANIWFGINQDGKDAEFENEGLHYAMGVSENYHIEDGMSSGLTPIDFVFFNIKSMLNYNIGDNTVMNGANLKICEKHACFKRAMLEFTYTLGKPGLTSKRKIFNEKAIGMSLMGTVTKTDAETVNVHLDIDGDNDNSDYPFNWTPTSGNLMYAMPRVGTQVSLLLPSEDERCAMATNSPRDEDATLACADMDDYNYRAFTTEHDKRMFLNPDSMGFIGTGNGESPLTIRLDDLEKMLFHSHDEIMILAQDIIGFTAPTITLYTPKNEKSINVARSDIAKVFECIITPIGSASMLPFSLRGDGDDSDTPSDDDAYPNDFTLLILHARFDVEGELGIFRATVYDVHDPFDDAPTEGEFSLGRSLLRGLVVGLVAVVAIAAVAAVVVVTGGAAVGLIAVAKVVVGSKIVAGAVMGATMAVVGVVIADVRSGNNSSWGQFVRAAAIGAVTGAISGGFGAKKAALKAKKQKAIALLQEKGLSVGREKLNLFLTDAALSAGIGMATSATSTALNMALDGKWSWDTLWRNTLRGGAAGALGAGLGTVASKVVKHKCPGSFLKKLENGKIDKANFMEVLGNRAQNALMGGLSSIVTGGLNNAILNTAEALWTAIRSGEGIDWGALARTFGDGFTQNMLMNFISGATMGAFRGDPVNAVYGFVYYSATDFEYPSVIPLVWERTWSSHHINQAPNSFGYGTGFSYGVYITHKEEGIFFVDSNGQGTQFDYLKPGETCVNRKSKMTLSFDGEKYEIFNHEERQYYTFENKPGTLICQLTQIETETKEHRITLGYDALHNLSFIKDTVGRRFNVITTNTGQITQVQFNGKILAKYVYDDNLDLVQLTDVHNKSAYFAYDNHLLVKRTTMEGTVFHWEYDGYGHNAKCIYTTGDDHLLEYWFEYNENHTVVTNSLGNREILHFTDAKILERITHENGYATIYEHNEYGEITSVTNADGETVKISYDNFGQPVEITQPNGATHKVEYDEQGRIIKSIDPLSLESTWVYDVMGRTSQFISPTGETTTYTYDNAGLLTELTTGEGEKELKTTLQYDDSLNLTQISYANGAIETWEYDTEGNCTKATSPLGAVESMSYDQGNRLVRYTSDDGNTTNLKYNAYDDIVWMKDSEREVRFAYNPLGKLTSRIEQHRRIKLQYDTEGQLTHVFNEANEEYTFEHDVMGNVTTETGYDNVRKSYTYTPAGKLKGMRRGNTANWTRMKYDKGGFLSKIIYDNGSITGKMDEEIFTYGIMGELLTAENKHSKLEFEYDKLGNLTKEIQNGYEVESSYSDDHTFTRTNLKTSVGLNVETILNKDGQAENISASFNSITTNGTTPISLSKGTGAVWQALQTYNIIGQLLERTISTVTGTTNAKAQGEIKDSWSYDRQGRPTQQKISINQREISKRQYTWGTGSKLKSIIDNVANMGLEYSYDSFGNPQKETLKGAKSQVTIRYLDDVGQVYETRSKIDRKYGKGGQLLVSKHRKYIYNDCGDMVEKVEVDGKTWKYTYNDGGLMQKVTRPDGKAVTFTYDAMARRISKTFDGITTKFIWDGNQIVHEWTETSSIPESTPTITPVSTWIFENGSFTPIAKLTENNAYTIFTDHLGTPITSIDASGNKAWNETLDVWGRQHNETTTKTIGKAKIITANFKKDNTDSNALDPTSSTNLETNIPFRFPGQYEDPETGLYYNRFRYYMPNEGIYTQRDPIGLAGDNPTVYGYVCHVLAEIDPFGLAEISGLPGLDAKKNPIIGIYILRDPSSMTAYVGQSYGAGGLAGRVNRESHEKAQALLKKPTTIVEYVVIRVSKKRWNALSESDKRGLLRGFEKKHFDKLVKLGYRMMNDDTVADPKKMSRYKKLAKDNKARAQKLQTVCRQ